MALSACGGGESGAGGGSDASPAEGGTLGFALASEPATLDPLVAAGRSSQILTRQIHEPLVETLTGPFGDVREVSGPAQTARPSSDRSIWKFRLRSRIRFQDGTPLNATAVLANAERWQAEPEGQALLPDLGAVDAPRPDLVRFILERPDAAFPERLSQARLGLVSPRALRRIDSAGAIRDPGFDSGTGAFELREREADGTAILARNSDWWGTRLDLGPALDQLSFPVVTDDDQRVSLLVDGDVEVADALTPRTAKEVRADPLLTVEGGGLGPLIGVERSVRGLDDDTEIPTLSGAWLTTVGAGE